VPPLRPPVHGYDVGYRGTESTEATGSHRATEARRVARDSGPA
jgi:hypothetical protein